MTNRFIGTAVAALVVACGMAQAVTIQTGDYRLRNHPDGNAQPPQYGLRLDELYNVTGDHDIFTFDFNHAGSAMYLNYNGSTIHIWGTTWGGRDTGSGYANDVHRGFYTVNFTYTIGVGLVPGDDDIFVNPGPGNYNYGMLTTPSGAHIPLRDGHYDNGTLDFRFGDEDNDLGHRGFNGISGWGWLFHGPYNSPYIASSDWLFTAEIIPAPGAAALMGLGAAMAVGRRRR